MKHKKNSILDLIGNTPLVPIHKLNPNRNVEVLAKLECFNPGGSVKDRPALYMIEEAEKKGELTKDKIILEATSGNTGIGLALVAAVKGYRILLVMSESVSEERVKILKAMGAEIKFTPAHLSTDGAIEYVYNLVRKEPDKYWLADQFNNEANWKAHYHGTALEIWEQTQGCLDIAMAAMGTTGTLMGLARRLRELDPNVKVVGVEPYLGHKIQGLKNMKESYQPGIFDRTLLDRIIHIDDEEAFQTARGLAKQEGLFVGMSSGAAMAAALRLAREMSSGRIVVVLPDGGERYLSTPLFTVKKTSGIRFYNTLTRKKEEFVPLEENRVTIYSCGPTLCHHITLGQCRRFIFADLLRRYLEFKGFSVTHIMNLTDLDDRTIEGAEKAGMSLKEFTESYYKAFLQDLEKLNIKKATHYPKASEFVVDMIEMVKKLMEKGVAYEKFRSIYFDISRVEGYGELSRIDLDKIRVGKTVDLDQYEKDNPRDFTLLKRSTLNELKKGIFFQTPWGNVRPSWHLECSAIARKLAGEAYDIHTSGVELIFPHHENAIAINRALSSKPPAQVWLHNEQVLMGGKAGNQEQDSITLREVLQRGYSGRQVRYFLLTRHYRKPLFLSWSKLEAVKNTLDHLDSFVQKIHFAAQALSNHEINQLIYDLRHGFTEALDDDMNIAAAFAALFTFMGRLNRIMDRRGLDQGDKEAVLKALDSINSVLGVMKLEPMDLSPEVFALIKKREQARKQKDWKTADAIRNQLKEKGIEIFDTPSGTIWKNRDS
ncbi:MAG: cysteine--tRNA ligase [Deltaproteobacteria bacterium]|nr:cysteine--tRNA ligase [Deltaproteobacteria bacterium]MBW2083741.1 cysteine--tRNA ligase [Deltaproteobacteria bacterium]HDM10731.1 cysteine--tRNA ligase [Desulfobacteraceae bacterium]